MQAVLHVYILCVIVCRCVSGERPIDKPLQALVSFQKRQTRIALVPTDSFQGESPSVMLRGPPTPKHIHVPAAALGSSLVFFLNGGYAIKLKYK